MASRINRAIELLAKDQAIYYVGAHTGHLLTRARGREDAGTWADTSISAWSHGAFDMPAGSPVHAGAGRGRPDPLRSSHPDGHRRGAGQRAPTRRTCIQCLAVPPDPRPRRAWRFCVPGRDRRRGAHLCRLPLSASPEGVRPFLPTPVQRMRGEASHGEPVGMAARRGRWGSGPAGAARRPPRRRSGASPNRTTASSATRGRSTRRANCCSGSSSIVRKVSPFATRSSPCPASASPRWGRAI